MTQTRNHDQIDDSEASTSPSKRARRSSSSSASSSEHEPVKQASGQDSVIAEGQGSSGLPRIPPATSLHIDLSTSTPTTPTFNTAEAELSKSNSGSASNSNTDTNSEHSSRHGRVPSGIEGSYFPDPYPSNAPSSPSNSGRVPSGIEGFHFPDPYGSDASSHPSESGRVQSGIEGSYFPEYYNCNASDSSSMAGSPELRPEEAIKAFEKQYNFCDNPDAIERGHAIISAAREILDRMRGSPTAKDKTVPLIKIAKEFPVMGETEFANKMIATLLNEARMVVKADVAPGTARSLDDFASDSKAWKADFLGSIVQAHFRTNSVPQAVAADDSFEKIFNCYPRLKDPRPDILFGLSEELLPNPYCAIFENSNTVRLTKQIHHPFLAGEFKTRDRPFCEAQLQCQRTGSAIVAYNADWNAEVKEQACSKVTCPLPEVDVETETSIPDLESWCFSVAITPDICVMYVNWREFWPNGAIYWHTNVLDHYLLAYGMKPAAERFQRHIRNILDWGLLERAPKVYEQAHTLAKRKVGGDEDKLPPPLRPKKQRTGTSSTPDGSGKSG